jgi:hypothetical protein
MEPLIPISDEIARAVQLSFPVGERQIALELLGTIEDGGNGTRGTILALSFGDLKRLRELVEFSSWDWRNIPGLMQSWEHGIDAHELYERYRKLGLLAPWYVEDRVHPKSHYETLVVEFLCRFTSNADLRRFPSSYVHVQCLRLRLQNDLNLVGNDGLRVVLDFADEFGVKMNTFRQDLHFPELERVSVLTRISRYFGIVRPPPSMAITIGDLVTAARQQRWPAISEMAWFAKTEDAP